MNSAIKILRGEREKLIAAIEHRERMIADERAEIEKGQKQIGNCRKEIEQIDVALKALAARKP